MDPEAQLDHKVYRENVVQLETQVQVDRLVKLVSPELLAAKDP